VSKIDKYNEVKQVTTRVIDNLTKALGKDRPDNDKHLLRVDYTGKHTNNWGDAVLHVHASYGYYGSSSGYRAMDKDVAKYLERAINTLMPQIAELAMELARKDLEAARLDARKEAEEILQDWSDTQ
jgi:hypothetical protein